MNEETYEEKKDEIETTIADMETAYPIISEITISYYPGDKLTNSPQKGDAGK